MRIYNYDVYNTLKIQPQSFESYITFYWGNQKGFTDENEQKGH